MIRFSANLGFLWSELYLPDAIRAAKRHGFDAVECHWPYEVPASAVLDALTDTGLSMLNINTVRGNLQAGEFGTAALPGREAETRDAIDIAISYSCKIGSPDIHVLAGICSAEGSRDVFLSNLEYACDKARKNEITILIEPVNTFDVEGYFLNKTSQAVSIIDELGADNLKIMFDCYHVYLMEGDVLRSLRTCWPYVRHVQFSSKPGRGTPDRGEINYKSIFDELRDLGHPRPLGAEYRPIGPTEESLDWMRKFRPEPV